MMQFQIKLTKLLHSYLLTTAQQFQDAKLINNNYNLE